MHRRVKVARVIDGDIFETDDDESIRLVGVNAPDIMSPGGIAAWHELRAMIDGKEVTILPKGEDMFGRTLVYITEIHEQPVKIRSSK